MNLSIAVVEIITVIKALIKHKIMYIETVLNAYMHTNTHTGTCTHQHTDYIKLNLHTTLKQAANRLVTLSLIINQTLKWLSLLPILMPESFI